MQGFLELVPSVSLTSRHHFVGQTRALGYLLLLCHLLFFTRRSARRGLFFVSLGESGNDGPVRPSTFTSIHFPWIFYSFQ